MVDFRKFLCCLLPVVLLSSLASLTLGQESTADTAKATFQRGLTEYQGLKFKEAKATLLKVKPDSLSADEKKQYSDVLGKLDGLIVQQSAAEADLASADKALEKNQFAEAKALYKKVAACEAIDPAKRKHAMDQAASIDKRIGSTAAVVVAPSAAVVIAPSAAPVVAAVPSGGESILTELERKRLLAKQAANVDIAENLKRANEILARASAVADFDAAQAAVVTAENVLQSNKDYYDESEYKDKKEAIDAQTRYVSMKRQVWAAEQANKQRMQIERAEKDRIEAQQTQLQSRITALSTSAQALMREHKYDEAIENVDQILKLEPGNRWANEAKDLLENYSLLTKEREYDHNYSVEKSKCLIDLRDAETPWYEILRYPKDWREITERRESIGAGQSTETEADRAVLNKLKLKIPNLNFDGIEFKEVISFLRDVANVNIHVNWSALGTAGIEDTHQVRNIHLTNIPVEKALKVILEDVGGTTELGYVVEDGVITISTKAELEKKTVTRVYDIRDLIISIPNFNAPRIDIGAATVKAGGGGGQALFSGGGATSTTNAGELTKTEMVTLITGLIKDTIAPGTWREPGAGGEGGGSIRELNGQLVVTHTAQNHRLLLDLINELREAKALQISIEARFIVVTSGFLESVGIDLQSYFNIGSRLGAAPLGSAANFVVDPVTGAQAGITGTNSVGVPGITKTTPGDKLGSTWSQQGVPTGHYNTDNFTPIAVQQGSFNSFTNMVGGNATSGINGGGIGQFITAPSISVAGTFLDDVQVDFLVQATQANQSGRQLTAPRITLFNGQRSYISIATQQAYVSDLTPVVSTNSVAYNPTISYVPIGSVLDIEATVSADRRYVTMTVRPQLCALDGPLQSYFIETASVDASGNPITGTGAIQLPKIKMQDLETTVSVPDGGTLMLGGQKETAEIENEQGVPLLSKIPVLDRLFTNRGKIRDEKTTLILIKPKIIIQREEEEKAFP